MIHTLPESIDWRWKNMRRIVTWLRANGIDPGRVPLHGQITWDSQSIVYPYFLVRNDELEYEVHTTALLVRWSIFRSHGPDRLCINGEAYRQRRKRRVV